MPVLRSIRERFAAERPLDGHHGRRVPARHRRDREPRPGAARRRRRGRAVRGQPALHPGRRRGGAGRGRGGRGPRAPRRGRRRLRRARRAVRRARRPHVTLDDGADLVDAVHTARADAARRLSAAPRRRPPGCARCARWRPRDAACPVLAVNEAHTERMFNDRYGTGQSTLDGILRATNVLLAGRPSSSLGYGWTGRGVAAARPRRRRAGRRLRGRPDARAGGADGGLRGHARARGGRARRRLRHRHRLARASCAASTSSA